MANTTIIYRPCSALRSVATDIWPAAPRTVCLKFKSAFTGDVRFHLGMRLTALLLDVFLCSACRPCFLELRAALSVVPFKPTFLNIKPWLCSNSLTVAKVPSINLCFPSRLRNRKTVLSLGMLANLLSRARWRYSGVLEKTSSIVESDGLNRH